MKTQQLVLRSAVTIVATGLTLLFSGTSEAHGRGPSGMRMSGSRGGTHNGAIQQTTSGRALARVRGGEAMGRKTIENRGRPATETPRISGRDDRGGRGEREARHGKDDGIRHDLRDDRGDRGEREPGDDKGRHHGRGNDDKAASTTAREREPGDDHGRKHRELGDDHGGRDGREPGDDHGRKHREPGDDHGGKR